MRSCAQDRPPRFHYKFWHNVQKFEFWRAVGAPVGLGLHAGASAAAEDPISKKVPGTPLNE